MSLRSATMGRLDAHGFAGSSPTISARWIAEDPAMLCEQSTHLWIGRFAVRLMALRETISMPTAVARAVAAHAYAGDLRPEDAARLDAAVPTWRLPSTPSSHTNLTR